jgi:hypothetical protein
MSDQDIPPDLAPARASRDPVLAELEAWLDAILLERAARAPRD